ncbi:hypothetical protein [Enorma massiliensis]|uniref:hypothetical protein n=1 Tax=Enorma massiliensis TaxID=1472761 RepID=UPI0023F20014|nr:hypothetical protein [Enorma massiliensis]
MNTATVAELGRALSAVLSSRGPAIATNNGRAQNLIANVSGMGIDEVVDLARSMQARTSLSSLHGSARGQGLGELSIEDIDAEVAAVRAAR